MNYYCSVQQNDKNGHAQNYHLIKETFLSSAPRFHFWGAVTTLSGTPNTHILGTQNTQTWSRNIKKSFFWTRPFWPSRGGWAFFPCFSPTYDAAKVVKLRGWNFTKWKIGRSWVDFRMFQLPKPLKNALNGQFFAGLRPAPQFTEEHFFSPRGTQFMATRCA